MAKIVEICGTPGVGKSTLYSSLLNKWNAGSAWVPAERLFPKQRIRYNKPTPFVVTFIKRWKGNYDKALMTEAGERFIETYPNYVNACWRSTNGLLPEKTYGTDIRFQSILNTYSLFQKVQLLRESQTPKTALLDEGLMQRIDSLVDRNRDWNNEKNDLEVILMTNDQALPDGLIYIETSIEECLKRFRARRKILKMYEKLPDDVLAEIFSEYQSKWNWLCNYYYQNEKPILKVDGTKKVMENVTIIERFMQQFAKNMPLLHKQVSAQQVFS